MKTYDLEFLQRQELTPEYIQKGITKEIRESLEAAVMTTAEKSLPTEVKTRLVLDQAQVSVAALIVHMLGRCMDKSEKRNDELRRVADKLK